MHDRQQRYENFINKMRQLYRGQKTARAKMNSATKRHQLANVLYQEPLKTVLSDYAKLSVHGFNDQLVAQFCENLNGVI